MPVVPYLASFVAAGVLAWGAMWVELAPWRASAGEHWTERARCLAPVRGAGVLHLSLIPALVVLVNFVLNPTLDWRVVAILAFTGATAAFYPIDRALHPDLTPTGWVHLALAGIVLRALRWLSLVTAAALMPAHVTRRTWIITAVYVTYLAARMAGGDVLLLRALRLVHKAPQRAIEAVARANAAFGITLAGVWELSSPSANAAAFLSPPGVAFTTKLLAIAPDEELETIAAHELAHLTEGRVARLGRIAGGFLIVPLIYVYPIYVASGDAAGVIALLVALLLLHLAVTKLVNVLEHRADRLAAPRPDAAPVYARALERMHAVNFQPAVSRGRSRTHPDLYDRMIAAGVTPTYARPLPPRARSIPAIVFFVTIVVITLAKFGES